MMYHKNFVAVIKSEGKILRERDNGTVFLPFGKHYSILLKNKDNRRALISVEIDGEDVLGGSQLILDGNREYELNGFMRDMNTSHRFKFINKTKEIQNYRGDRIDDGVVRISYQFEKIKINVPICTPIVYPNNWKVDYKIGDFIDNFSNIHHTSNDTYLSCCNVSKSVPNIDEGITVKGEKINQNYFYGNVGDLDRNIETIILYLKGVTKQSNVVITKPVTIKSKLQCETCGRRNRSSNKYCFNCGTCLE